MATHSRRLSRRSDRSRDQFSEMLTSLRQFTHNIAMRGGGLALILLAIWIVVALSSFSISDPSFNNATPAPVQNSAGYAGAVVADLLFQVFGVASFLIVAPLMIWGGYALVNGAPEETPREFWIRIALLPVVMIAATGAIAAAPTPAVWPYMAGAGGVIGDGAMGVLSGLIATLKIPAATFMTGLLFVLCAVPAYLIICGLTMDRAIRAWWAAEDIGVDIYNAGVDVYEWVGARIDGLRSSNDEDESDEYDYEDDEDYEYEEGEDSEEDEEPTLVAPERKRKIIRKKTKNSNSRRERREKQPVLPVFSSGDYELPPLNLLAKPNPAKRAVISDDALEQNARMLENVLSDFGVRGEIINVRPGPVVTLYELEPAAGIKSSRVIGLADDIARSMSAVACRVAVVPGRNVIGIELPNQDREMVYLRELLGAEDYENTRGDLTLALGKSIGGEPTFADLARMPHLLIAGTTGSGKSVGINTMIMSLLYRMAPDECKLILIDPKMLELSVYEGIPHLLAPVVTDPRKAVVALKWTVREMEERYRRMSKVGVRNIEGFNTRVSEAEESGEVLTRTVHTGYDEDSGEPVYETEELDYEFMPFIVVVIDEVADLMMVAGKDIEGMVQRLAQMARAAGIHLIMATQRPSVDVITGTIKANFPTRISFQVTSKIDSRTILGEQGAEQLLGQGDMLHMAGGGRLRRVHGAFVSDDEVEKIVKFLKKQGAPEYVKDVTEMKEDEGGEGGFDIGGNTSSGDALYDRAVAVVLRDRKASTSYVQRRLQIGYNRAATLIERMEEEGVISAANHAGKREILVGEDAA